MNKSAADGKGNPLLRAAADKSLSRKLKKYVEACRPPPQGDPKREGRLPNLAGFCSSLRCGNAAIEEFRRSYPTEFDYVCAVLEDEALNSSRSPAIVNAYLKEKFGYGDKSETSEGDGAVQLVFEHDILEDGE